MVEISIKHPNTRWTNKSSSLISHRISKLRPCLVTSLLVVFHFLNLPPTSLITSPQIHKEVDFQQLFFHSPRRRRKKKDKLRNNGCASSSQARRGEEVIRFFKLIFDSTILEKKMMPKKFVSDFGQQLVGCDAATLEVPSGDKWEVGLETDRKGFVAFCNDGWERFAKFYPLEHGQFLLFEYKGCSDFSVVICDISAAEIAYRTLSFRPASVEIKHEEEEDSLSLESLSVDAAAANEREKGKSHMVDDSAG